MKIFLLVAILTKDNCQDILKQKLGLIGGANDSHPSKVKVTHEVFPQVAILTKG